MTQGSQHNKLPQMDHAHRLRQSTFLEVEVYNLSSLNAISILKCNYLSTDSHTHDGIIQEQRRALIGFIGLLLPEDKQERKPQKRERVQGKNARKTMIFWLHVHTGKKR